jgi:hypothetical protein
MNNKELQIKETNSVSFPKENLDLENVVYKLIQLHTYLFKFLENELEFFRERTGMNISATGFNEMLKILNELKNWSMQDKHEQHRR